MRDSTCSTRPVTGRETTMLPCLMTNSSSPGSPIRKRMSPFRSRRSRNAYHTSRRTDSSTSWKSGTRRRNAISGSRSIRPVLGARSAAAVWRSGGPSLQHDALKRVGPLLLRAMDPAAEGLQDDGALFRGQLVTGQRGVGLANQLGKDLPIDHHAPNQVLDRLARHGSVTAERSPVVRSVLEY